MKNINLTKDQFKTRLSDHINQNFKNSNFNDTSIQNNGTQFCVTIAGQESFIFNVWEKSDGLSVQIQGKDKSLGESILSKLIENVSKVVQRTETFTRCTEQVYNKIKEYFESISDYNVNEIWCSTIQKNLIIEKGSSKITVQYYNTTHKCVLSGKTTFLWHDVLMELTSNLNMKIREILKLSIKTSDELQSIEINYDDGILDGLLKYSLTEDVYNDEQIINEEERQLLKTSVFLLFTEIQLPEYFATVASSIKVTEGVLRRILFDTKDIPISKELNYFIPNRENTHWTLKDEYKQYFLNKTEHIKLVDDLYTFIKRVRHKYFHDDGYNTSTITDKKVAESIFQQIIDLLKRIKSTHIM